MKKIIKDVVKETVGIGKSAAKRVAQESIEIPKSAGKEVIKTPVEKEIVKPSPIVEAMTQKSEGVSENSVDEKKKKIEGIKRVQRLEKKVEQIRKQKAVDFAREMQEQSVNEGKVVAPGSPMLPESKQSKGRPQKGKSKSIDIPKSKH